MRKGVEKGEEQLEFVCLLSESFYVHFCELHSEAGSSSFLYFSRWAVDPGSKSNQRDIADSSPLATKVVISTLLYHCDTRLKANPEPLQSLVDIMALVSLQAASFSKRAIARFDLP